MARGRYLSLEEARRMKRLDQFAKEHPSEGNEKKFDDLLKKMAPKKGAVSKSSSIKGGHDNGAAGNNIRSTSKIRD